MTEMQCLREGGCYLLDVELHALVLAVQESYPLVHIDHSAEM